jgi:DNA-binding transcriptional MocR family regulator
VTRTCTICNHPERAAIESDIVTGVSNRSIALQYGMSHMSVQRHATEHIARAIAEVKQEQAIQSGSAALDRMSRGEAIIDEMIKEYWSVEKGEVKVPDLTLKALAELRRQVELRAKLEGELDEHTITITSIPEWRELRALLLDALSMHPQAKMAVMRALEVYDAQSA